MAEKKAHKPKARANGEGTLFQRKSDDLWIGRLPVGYKSDGSVKYLKFSGKKQSDVLEKMGKAKTEVRTNTYVEPNKITLGEWLDTWLTVTMKTSIRETTYLSYEAMIKKHIKPALGGYKLLQLQTSHIQKFYNEKIEGGRADGKEGGLSPRTVRYIHQVITGALKQAVAEKVVQVNVADHVKLPKNPKKEMKYLDVSAVGKFLEVAKNSQYYKHYYAAYVMELYTGLRRGELLGLRWKDIDLKNGAITVSQQLVKVGNKHIIRELKTESSQNRNISIPGEVVTAMKEHKRQQEEHLKDLGYNDIAIAEHFKSGLTFINEVGTGFIQPRNFTRNFKGVLRTAKLDDVRFHDMRHTFALISLQAGTDIKTLQSDLGHESIETTLDRYGHVNPEMKKEAANKRSGLLKAVVNNEKSN